MTPEDELGDDCRLVLNALRAAPEQTMTNVELAQLKGGAFAWRSRVSDLRFKHGYPISEAKKVPGQRGVFQYALMAGGEPLAAEAVRLTRGDATPRDLAAGLNELGIADGEDFFLTPARPESISSLVQAEVDSIDAAEAEALGDFAPATTRTTPFDPYS